MSILIDLAFIFFARVTDVSLATIRVLMVMRAHRLVAATLGFFEIIIYILALNRVVNHLDTPLNLVVYALGFAMGTIEQFDRRPPGRRFLPGGSYTKGDGEELARELRKHKFGVTLLRGEDGTVPQCTPYHITTKETAHFTNSSTSSVPMPLSPSLTPGETIGAFSTK